jgi:hypothetical protein
VLEIGRLDRSGGAHVLEQAVHAGAMLAMHALCVLVGPVIVARIRAMPVQREIGDRREACLVRPALEDVAGLQRLVEPLLRVGAEAREQHQIRAARDDMDRVDLQQLHRFDRHEQAPARGPGARRPQQALRGEVQVAGLLRGQNEVGDHGAGRDT